MGDTLNLCVILLLSFCLLILASEKVSEAGVIEDGMRLSWDRWVGKWVGVVESCQERVYDERESDFLLNSSG